MKSPDHGELISLVCVWDGDPEAYFVVGHVDLDEVNKVLEYELGLVVTGDEDTLSRVWVWWEVPDEDECVAEGSDYVLRVAHHRVKDATMATQVDAFYVDEAE